MLSIRERVGTRADCRKQQGGHVCLSVNTGVSGEFQPSATATSGIGTSGSRGEYNTEKKGLPHPPSLDRILVNSPNLQCLSFRNTMITRLHPHKYRVYLNSHSRSFFSFSKQRPSIGRSHLPPAVWSRSALAVHSGLGLALLHQELFWKCLVLCLNSVWADGNLAVLACRVWFLLL